MPKFVKKKIAQSVEDVYQFVLQTPPKCLPTGLIALQDQENDLHITMIYDVLSVGGIGLFWIAHEAIHEHVKPAVIVPLGISNIRSMEHPEALIVEVFAKWNPSWLPTFITRYMRRTWRPHVTYKDGQMKEFKPDTTLTTLAYAKIKPYKNWRKQVGVGYNEYLGV